MDIQALRYLVTLCETNSFSETADLHYISTSTCSRKIRSLEEEMGCALFVRDSHGVEPTPAGMEMRDIARRMLSMIDHLDRSNLEAMDGTYGQIVLAMDPLDCGADIRPCLKRFLQAYPRIELAFRTASIARMETGLLDHVYDAGLLIKPEDHVYELFDCIVLRRMGLRACVHREHPLAGRTSVSLKDLLDWQIVLFERDRAPDVYDAIVQQLRSIISLTWICTVDNLNLMMTMCDVNKAIGICFPCEIPVNSGDFQLLPIDGLPESFEYVFAVKRGLTKMHLQRLCRMIAADAQALQNR